MECETNCAADLLSYLARDGCGGQTDRYWQGWQGDTSFLSILSLNGSQCLNTQWQSCELFQWPEHVHLLTSKHMIQYAVTINCNMDLRTHANSVSVHCVCVCVCVADEEAYSTTCQSSDKETKRQSPMFSGNSQIRWQNWERYHYKGHHWQSLTHGRSLQLKWQSAPNKPRVLCLCVLIMLILQTGCQNSIRKKWSHAIISTCYSLTC